MIAWRRVGTGKVTPSPLPKLKNKKTTRERGLMSARGLSAGQATRFTSSSQATIEANYHRGDTLAPSSTSASRARVGRVVSSGNASGAKKPWSIIS